MKIEPRGQFRTICKHTNLPFLRFPHESRILDPVRHLFERYSKKGCSRRDLLSSRARTCFFSRRLIASRCCYIYPRLNIYPLSRYTPLEISKSRRIDDGRLSMQTLPRSRASNVNYARVTSPRSTRSAKKKENK